MNFVLAIDPTHVTLAGVNYEEIVLTGASTPLNATKAGACWYAVIRADGGGTARYRIDGQAAPTAAIGMPFLDGETLVLSRIEAQAFRAFLSTGAITLRVTYLASA